MMLSLFEPVARAIIESLCGIFFINTFLEKRNGRCDAKHKALATMILILFNIVFALIFARTDDILSVALRWAMLSLLIFIVARIFYQGNSFRIAVISGLVFIFFQFTHTICLSTMELLHIDQGVVPPPPHAKYEIPFPAMFFVEMLALIIVVLLVRCAMRVLLGEYYATQTNMKNRNWLLVLIVPAMGLLSIWVVFAFADEGGHSGPIVLFLAIGWLLVSLTVMCTIFISSIREQQLREHMMMQEKNKHSEKYYLIERKRNEQLRALQHDVLKHYSFLNELLKSGEVTRAMQYLGDVAEDGYSATSRINTNNEAVNIILNEKINVCKEKGIGLVFQINDLSAVPLADKDMVIILSNILDNAIEACEKCSGDRTIRVKLIKNHDQFVVSVKNPYEGRLSMKGDKLMTSKEDDFYHGMGLTSVGICLIKYNGTYAINGDKNQFHFSAVIPVP